eukprot:CAMPEP_0197864376 /NCGR_PEP_ID=MMETSP1438-20131217/42575_1 /TAXON_ID=1461541 /ORGANISM="Pterosperma sp., Strain CCMP1384" /LENGTH=51 /DNA_ID=CAMNT_0043482607 /DNA_START=92 /DNA_END=247 /DNA_ORIENTATION=-
MYSEVSPVLSHVYLGEPLAGGGDELVFLSNERPPMLDWCHYGIHMALVPWF